nr:DUF1642 domain-containing protein [Lactococcus lactis]
MTKFEEEVKRPANGPLTELNNNMQEVFSQYRKMRQYADYLEYDSKQKDEYILKLENENSFMRDERTAFDSNGMAVEPKLQQQALPVVPERVAEWISEDIENNTAVEDILTILITSDDKDLKEYGLWIKKNPVTYAIARTLGYTVEKPQPFYLKHIDMSETDEHYDYYLSKSPKGNIFHSNIGKGKLPKLKCILKLTQQEIESLHAGSYEQIEVEK